jgi:hypothetical protein
MRLDPIGLPERGQQPGDRALRIIASAARTDLWKRSR